MDGKPFFELPGGASARRFELRNASGFGADITDFGGAVVSLFAPDRAGELRDVVLGYRDPAAYIDNIHYFGALVGRIPNRIGGGRFTFDGTVWQMVLNDGGHSTLHGGFSHARRLWQVAAFDGRSLTLALHSPDGDAGFPGGLDVTAVYGVTEDNTLTLEISAVADRATVADYTNHMYFNLAGEASGDCLDHRIRINAARRTAVDRYLVPTGVCPEVAGTKYDLRSEKTFADIFRDLPKGFDDNFILADDAGEYREAATVVSERSGIAMTVGTTAPGVQFYMGDCLDATIPGKGCAYPFGSGFCLETQNWPDAVNHPSFPSPRLEPGQRFRVFTDYKFTVK